MNIFLAAGRLPDPGAAGRRGRGAGALARHARSNNVDFGTSPTPSDFLIAIPVGMVAYTGIETISNMAEEARDYGKTIPRGIGGVVVAVVVDLRLPARRRALGHAGRGRRDRCWPSPRRRAASPTTRSWAWSRTWTSARSRAPAEVYVGILAATILFVATNAGLIGVSRLTYSMGQYRQLPEAPAPAAPAVPHAVRRHPGLRRRGLPDHRPRAGRLPGHDLRLRRDALVHHRACCRWSRCGSSQPDAERPYGPGQPAIRRGTSCPLLRGPRRAGHRDRVRGGHRCST